MRPCLSCISRRKRAKWNECVIYHNFHRMLTRTMMQSSFLFFYDSCVASVSALGTFIILRLFDMEHVYKFMAIINFYIYKNMKTKWDSCVFIHSHFKFLINLIKPDQWSWLKMWNFKHLINEKIYIYNVVRTTSRHHFPSFMYFLHIFCRILLSQPFPMRWGWRKVNNRNE